MAAPETLSAQMTAPAETPGERGVARRHFKTAGEHKFNWQTYTGLGYFANVAISIASIFWAERSHSGQKAIQWLGGTLKKMHVPGDAERIGRKSFFLTGGFVVIPLMKMLEDGKVERVKRYNREIYGPQADSDPTILQSEQELERAPKQGWASIVSGRLLALVPFYATMLLMWEKESPVGKALGGWGIDRPITHFSRDLGKLWASGGRYFDALHEVAGVRKLYHGVLAMAGKALRLLPVNEAAVRQIEAMEVQSPGAMRSVKVLDAAAGKAAGHDPNHSAIPYYFMSEAITSAMVAWGIYAITRITGPLFAHKRPLPAAEPATAVAAVPVAMQPAPPPPQERTGPPTNQVNGKQHEGVLQPPQLAAALHSI